MISAEVFFDRSLQPRRRYVQFDWPAGKPPPQTERGNSCDRAANQGAQHEPPHKARVDQLVGGAVQPGPIPAPGPTSAPSPEPTGGGSSTRRMTHSDCVGAVSVLVLGPCHALFCAPRPAQDVLRPRPDPQGAQLTAHTRGARCATPV